MTAASQAQDGFDEQVVLDEINLYAELVIAAEASEGPLTQGEIDRVLGVRADAGPDG